MKLLKVEYQVMSEQLHEMLPVIQKFIKASQADRRVVRYDGYQFADDPTKFVHVMGFESAEDEEAHKNAPYTLEFVSELYPSCKVQPVFQELLDVSA